MSDDWEKYVVPHVVELVKILQPSCFLDHLRADGLLNQEDYDTLESYQTDQSRSRKLLNNILPKKGPDALPRFCSILQNVEGQEHAAELIQGKRSVLQASSSRGSVERKRSLSDSAKKFRGSSKSAKSTFYFRQEDKVIVKDREAKLRAMCSTFLTCKKTR